jgi:hypothetical protein
MKRALVAILFGCMTLGLASLAMAFDNDQAAIVAHITPHLSQVCTPGAQGGGMGLTGNTLVTGVNDGSGCNDNIGGARWDVWLLVCNGSDSLGVRGAEFGITYNPDPFGGLYGIGWNLCADQNFPEPGWPSPDRGNTITWIPASCQIQNSEPFVPQTVIAVMGSVDMITYDPDVLQIIPKPLSGRAEIADCNGAQESILGNSPSHLGFSEWCLGPGYNPCGLPTATEPTTWGRLKQIGNK